MVGSAIRHDSVFSHCSSFQPICFFKKKNLIDYFYLPFTCIPKVKRIFRDSVMMDGTSQVLYDTLFPPQSIGLQDDRLQCANIILFVHVQYVLFLLEIAQSTSV